MFWPCKRRVQILKKVEWGVGGGRRDAAAQTEKKSAPKKLGCLFTDCRHQGHLRTF